MCVVLCCPSRCTLQIFLANCSNFFHPILNLEVQAATAHPSQAQIFRIYQRAISPGEITLTRNHQFYIDAPALENKNSINFFISHNPIQVPLSSEPASMATFSPFRQKTHLNLTILLMAQAAVLEMMSTRCSPKRRISGI